VAADSTPQAGSAKGEPVFQSGAASTLARIAVSVTQTRTAAGCGSPVGDGGEA
jgi:hypothetical protein